MIARLLAPRSAAAVLLLLPLTGCARSHEAELLGRLHTQKAPEIYETARSLGQIGSVQGLKTLVEFPDSQLLQQYQTGFAFSRGTDGEVEQVIIDHYQDPKLRPVLVQLINATHPYHTRRLFDLMAATIKDPATTQHERGNMAWSITQTDLAVDDDLFALLRALPPEKTGYTAAGQLLQYLGERRYAPLVAYLRPIVPTAPVGELCKHCVALVRVGTEESLALAMPCIARLSAERKNHDALNGELSSILRNLAELPPATPLQLSVLKGVLPTPLGSLATIDYIKLIGHRHDPSGIPDLLAYLQTNPKGPRSPYDTPHYRALEALLDFEAPDVWQQTLNEIERQHGAALLTDWEYQFATSELQRRLNDPRKFSDYKRRQETAAVERTLHNAEWKREAPARARRQLLGQVASWMTTFALGCVYLILLGGLAWDVRREWQAALWRWFLIAIPFLVLSALDATWLVLHTPPPGMTFPPKSESMLVGLILIWSFYPGALTWGVLFRWCLEKWRSGAWPRWRALGVFWSTSFLTAPIPALIHSVIIMQNQASRHGPFAQIGEGAMFVIFLPIVAAALSTLVTGALAGRMWDPSSPQAPMLPLR